MDAFDVWYSLENALPLIGTNLAYPVITHTHYM